MVVLEYCIFFFSLLFSNGLVLSTQLSMPSLIHTNIHTAFLFVSKHFLTFAHTSIDASVATWV